jgi:predicted metal-dependent phosphoesterase TrpH
VPKAESRIDARAASRTPAASPTPAAPTRPAYCDPAPAGMLRLDLHLHTWGSWDCLSHPDEVLEQARARGVERIAITDHNRLGVALAMAARHPDAIIAGEEVKTAEGIDVIGLYLFEAIPKGTPMLEVVKRIRDQGGIVYLPHPYAAGKGGGGRHAETLAPHVDVVEVWNGRLQSAAAQEAARALAQRTGRLMGVGTDAHSVAEVGASWIQVPHHPNNPGALLDALRSGRVELSLHRASPRVFFHSNWAKIRKRLPGAPGGGHASGSRG